MSLIQLKSATEARTREYVAVKLLASFIIFTVCVLILGGLGGHLGPTAFFLFVGSPMLLLWAGLLLILNSRVVDNSRSLTIPRPIWEPVVASGLIAAVLAVSSASQIDVYVAGWFCLGALFGAICGLINRHF